MRPNRHSHALIASGLLFAVFLWGGNNVGTKYIVGYWPPVWVGASRFLVAGLLLTLILRLRDQNKSRLFAGSSSRL